MIDYQVFTTINGVDSAGVHYKQLKRVRESAKRSALNLLATKVWILGFDKFGEPTGFKEIIKCPCPEGYHSLFQECRPY